MFVKGLALTALVASTPLALFVTHDAQQPQDPKPAAARPAERSADVDRINQDLRRARAELHAAREDVQRLRGQLDAALDRLEEHYQPERDRNCSPSRGRALMSHYQWLRGQGHEERAGTTLAKVVDQVGDDVGRQNSAAWELMTEKDSAGKFDEVALAIARRMDQRRAHLNHNYLDTVALAYFLNGEVELACTLEQQAIEKGGRGDDFRRRLRTYEAARDALVAARRANERPAATMVAVSDDED
ncbi:MAG: hypothetical protein H6835_09800 [Planctomycetes bacterium]|nr:hypothetical protein [Planctomycetota bacterium]